MRDIDAALITAEIARLCGEANVRLPVDVTAALDRAAIAEQSPVGQELLRQLADNARLAADSGDPICQDTGLAVVWVDLGQDVHIVGGDLATAIDEGVRSGYRDNYLRASVVSHPLRRCNTGDNTPAMTHLRVVPGDRLTLTVAPKGAGSENMSALAMLKPADGRDGVIEFVIRTVERAGAKACPPLIVGVGIGGTMELAATLAKRALLRPVGMLSPDVDTAALETELLRRVNDTGIGPQGFGGRITALGVACETAPCHIASLPVAVNLNCHAGRHAAVTI